MDLGLSATDTQEKSESTEKQTHKVGFEYSSPYNLKQ